MSMWRVIAATRRRMYAFEAAAALAARGREPRLPLPFHSQFGEDTAIWDIFDGQLDGFFIEVGAFDGVSFSVTYALEAAAGTGCWSRRSRTEPSSAVLRGRTAAWCVRRWDGAAATGSTSFTVVSDELGGMLSHMKPAVYSTTASRVAAQGPSRAITVPLTSLDELLRDHTGEIDVAVIDVEGAELDVLSGFDVMRHRPKVLIIEDNTMGQDRSLAAWMGTVPYTAAGWISVNNVYVRSDLRTLRARARSVL